MYTMILLSGGVGSRMHNNVPKQYMLLAGKPVIMHILERAERIKDLKKVVVVCAEEYKPSIELMVRQYNVQIPVVYAPAGGSRQASVYSGLDLVDTDKVIIHEAARPFVDADDFNELVSTSEENVMTGISIPFTVIKGEAYVSGLLNRSELVNVQLPQKFNTKLLIDAHKKAVAEGKHFTEDASLVYYYNPEVQIRIIKGKEYNIKITTPTDMITGELIYKEYFAGRK
jgi:2-C-methyl-D-erythritol 4-phosphate cytidylyltransferase